jgi:hypothetical protein
MRRGRDINRVAADAERQGSSVALAENGTGQLLCQHNHAKCQPKHPGSNPTSTIFTCHEKYNLYRRDFASIFILRISCSASNSETNHDAGRP